MANNGLEYYNSKSHLIVVETSELSNDFIMPVHDADMVEVWDAYFGG